MNNVLVTGGAGFLGSHLCAKLLTQGNSVICLDNLHTGAKQNISSLSDTNNFEFMLYDVTMPLQLKVDQIYNLACPASPLHYQASPVSTVKTAVHGAINMLELAQSSGAKILQASTSEVYGDPEQHPQKETYQGNVNPIGPRACYDEGKRCAETLFFDYHRQFDALIKVVRIFNTYGPNMQIQDGRVISNFIIQALKGEDITIFGDGHQTRSFCYVDDIINGLIKMMNTEDNVTGPVNLGNPVEFRISDIATKVIEMTGSKSKVTFLSRPDDDPKRRCPDISLAKKLLSWEPKVDLDEGLSKTIDFFSNRLKLLS